MISAKSSRDTIWKPPLSVKMLRSHCMNLCKPPKSASQQSGAGTTCYLLSTRLAAEMVGVTKQNLEAVTKRYHRSLDSP